MEINKVNVLNVEFVEHRTGVGKESLVSMRVKLSRRVVALKVTKQARSIKSGKTLTVEVKIYFIWSYTKMRHAGSRFMYKFLQTHLKLYHQYQK